MKKKDNCYRTVTYLVETGAMEKGLYPGIYVTRYRGKFFNRQLAAAKLKAKTGHSGHGGVVSRNPGINIGSCEGVDFHHGVITPLA